MKDAKGHGSNAKGAHASGINQLGQKFRLNTHTHEIVRPDGSVAARMRVGKSNGLAVDQPGVGAIARSGGTAIHDAVAMADFRAQGNSFPADRIGGELHYLTGNDFEGHTVRPVVRGMMRGTLRDHRLASKPPRDIWAEGVKKIWGPSK